MRKKTRSIYGVILSMTLVAGVFSGVANVKAAPESSAVQIPFFAAGNTLKSQVGNTESSTIRLTGSAKYIEDNNNAGIELVPAENGESGGAFLNAPLVFSDEAEEGNVPGFSIGFKARMGASTSGAPADGFVFVIARNTTSLGSAGGGIGYEGINNSIGIEYDTYNNGSGTVPHTSLFTNGNTDYDSDGSLIHPLGWSNATDYDVFCWVDYDYRNKKLEVRYSKTIERPDTATITEENFDVTSYIGAKECRIGFTAATGGSNQQIVVSGLYYDDEYKPIDMTGNTTYQSSLKKITYDLDGGSATNLGAYIEGKSNFKLNNPTKEGAVFTGWTGTGITTAQEEVTITKDTRGDLSFTATWMSELDKAKKDAKKAIDDEVGDDTSEKVKKEAEEAKKAIDEAEDPSDVNKKKESGIDAVKTAKAKEAAKKAIDDEVGSDTSEKVKKEAEAAKKAIDEAEDPSDVNKKKESGIDAVKTAKAKEAAKKAIDAEVGNDTSEAVKATAEAAKKAIDEATSLSDVSDKQTSGIDAVKTAKAKEAAKKTIDAEVGNDTSEAVKEAAKKAINEATSLSDVSGKQTSGIEAVKTAKSVNKEEVKVERTKSNDLDLAAKFKLTTGKKITVAWGKVADADGYEVYMTYCGTRHYALVKSVDKDTLSATISKLKNKPIDQKKHIKCYVAAYKTVDGKKVTIGRTINAHAVGKKNGKATDAVGIKISKKAYTLKVGKKTTIKAKTVKKNKKLPILPKTHTPQFRYDTSDSSVATVSSKGKITAVRKGTCIVYVYAVNGYARKIKVTVK